MAFEFTVMRMALGPSTTLPAWGAAAADSASPCVRPRDVFASVTDCMQQRDRLSMFAHASVHAGTGTGITR